MRHSNALTPINATAERMRRESRRQRARTVTLRLPPAPASPPLFAASAILLRGCFLPPLPLSLPGAVENATREPQRGGEANLRARLVKMGLLHQIIHDNRVLTR
jgi:hypothetical protein